MNRDTLIYTFALSGLIFSLAIGHQEQQTTAKDFENTDLLPRISFENVVCDLCGAGKLEHLYDAIVDGGADAVLMASITHFGNYTIRQMKEYLAGRGIAVNL